VVTWFSRGKFDRREEETQAHTAIQKLTI